MAVRFFFTLSLVLYLSPFLLGYSGSDIKTWCSQTPHPQPCEDLLSHNKNLIPITQKSQFFHISTQLALDQAMHAQTNLFSLGSKCENPRAKAAWDDCLELYDHTIRKLNTTINPSTNCTQEGYSDVAQHSSHKPRDMPRRVCRARGVEFSSFNVE